MWAGYCIISRGRQGRRRIDKLEKIQAVIEYIEGHLTQKVDLDAIAGVVYYSKHYLHRLFSQTVGLTIHDYFPRPDVRGGAGPSAGGTGGSGKFCNIRI